ncbi:MAG: hypothetical protein ACOZDD_08905 [Bacteroidota bacterium]
MKVAELIEKLKLMPIDALVVTEGYEDGFDNIKRVSVITVEDNPNKAWYVGQYIDSKKTDAQKCVFLNTETKAENK